MIKKQRHRETSAAPAGPAPVDGRARSAATEGSRSRDLRDDFTRAGEEKQLSLLQEFSLFIIENKKWWLIPILLVLAIAGLLVVFGSTGAAPFIYTLI